MSDNEAGLVKVDLGDGLDWGKTSRSGGNGGACVAVTTDGHGTVAIHNGAIGIADTTEGPGGTRLWVSREDFRSLIYFTG